ncbi:hypothetical protein ACFUEM_23620 [Streptomyces anulatus]|uniref:hypothetical protein n=1 Tax=Streptomyces anulatus TaxID=1892 RepID=UPI0035E217F3
MSNVLRMNSVRRKRRKLVSTTVPDAIDFSEGPGPARAVAYPERQLPQGGIPAYLAARKSGVRSFVLWADEDRRERVATVVTESAAGGVATFHVLGAHGEHLGTIVREKAFRGRGLRAPPPAHPMASGRQDAPGVQIPGKQAASARAGDGLAARGGAGRPGGQFQRRHVGRPEDVRVVFRVGAQ